VSGVTLAGVEVSAEAVARVPGEHLRVSRTEFGALWALAEQIGGQPGDGGEYLLGVILTSEWLADQPVPSVLPSRVAEMPPATAPYAVALRIAGTCAMRTTARGCTVACATRAWRWRTG